MQRIPISSLDWIQDMNRNLQIPLEVTKLMALIHDHQAYQGQHLNSSVNSKGKVETKFPLALASWYL